MIEFSDEDFECVVNKIFEGSENSNQHDGKISTKQVIKYIAPHMGPKWSEFMTNLLDPYSEDRKVTQNELKSALLKLSKTLNCEKDLCVEKDLSLNMEYSIEFQSKSSFCDVSSEGFIDGISDLQNELAEKQFLVSKLHRQLSQAAQITQQQEEALASLAEQRDELHNKLITVQLSNDTLVSLKEDYEELLESLTSKSKALQTNIDKLKKENAILNTRIEGLDKEKDILSQELLRMDIAKKKALELLFIAQSDRNALNIKCLELTEKTANQEKVIEEIKSFNYLMEVKIQNTLNVSAQEKIYRSFDSDEMCPSPITSLETDLIQSGAFYYETEDLENKFHDTKSNCANHKWPKVSLKTSVQEEASVDRSRNELSLLEELSQVNEADEESDNINTSNARLMNDKPEIINLVELQNHQSVFESNEKITCNDSDQELSEMKNALKVQKNINDDLILKLNKSASDISLIEKHVVTLQKRIFEMKTYETLLSIQNTRTNNAMKEVMLNVVRYKFDQREAFSVQRLQLKKALENVKTMECPACLECREIMTVANYPIETQPVVSTTMQYCGNICCWILRKFLFWGTIICFTMGCLHLYNVLRYTSAIRSHTRVHLLPWRYMSITEIISSIFDYKNTGPAPI